MKKSSCKGICNVRIYKSFKLFLFSHFWLIAIFILAACNEQINSSYSNEEKNPTNEASSDDQISEYIRHIHQDKHGHFWFGTNGYGLAHYDGDTLSYYSTNQGFGGTQITGISEDPDKNLWFATDEGVVKYDFCNLLSGVKLFTNFYKDEFFNGKRFWSIYADSKGDVWAGAAGNMFRYNNGVWNPFELSYDPIDELKNLLTDITTWCTIEDSNGNLWFATNGNGVIKYQDDSISQFTEDDGLANNQVDHILEDRNGHMWFGTREGGASYFDGKTFTNYTYRDSIGNNEVCVIHEDMQGHIWMSSEGYGVYRFDGTSFKNFYIDEGLEVRAVQAIYSDKNGSLWVGGGGGLYRFNGTTFKNVKKSGPWE